MKRRTVLAMVFLALAGCSALAQPKPVSNLTEVMSTDEWQLYKLTEQKTDFLYFYSDHCEWCVKQSPEIVKLAAKYPALKFIKVNVTNLKSIGKEMRVRSYPTTMFAGKRFVGYNSFESLDTQISNYLENDNRFPEQNR